MSVAIQQAELPAEGDSLIQWYQANSRLGSISFGVAVDSETCVILEGPHRVLRQGLLLADIELVVQGIELWLDVELDLVPLGLTHRESQEDQQEPRMAEALISPVVANALPEVYLQIPLSSIDQIDPIDVVLTDQLRFQWTPLPLDLVIAEMSLTQTEFNDIGMGSFVLLPDSFRSGWMVNAVFPGAGSQRVSLTLNPETCQFEQAQFDDRVEPACNTENSESSEVVICIRTQQILNYDPGHLLGFDSGDAPSMSDLEQMNLQLESAGEVLARGRLIRVGQGYGLVVLEADA